MTDFSEIAADYEKNSLVQRSASDQLFDLVRIGAHEDVLDLGCGTGHLTKKIVEKTTGKVVGLDVSEGMIEEATRSYSRLGITFRTCPAEQLPCTDAFDVIFCNSAFQWFKDPGPALKSCHAALKHGGRIGIQAPARTCYSPNFIEAVRKVEQDSRLGERFASFQSPWCFLETAEEYEACFKNAGFEVRHARIDQVVSPHTPEKVFSIFDSGASAGYLNPRCYALPLSEDYFTGFRETVKQAFTEQADDHGQVALTFFRIYLLAVKP